MTASKNNIPAEITALSERFKTVRRPPTTPFEPSEFLHPSEAEIPYYRGERDNLIIEICQAVASHTQITFPHQDGIARATSLLTKEVVYFRHARRHAYEGTVILALLESLRDVLSWSQFVEYRTRLRTRTGNDRVFWELARHFGRPSVPSHVLPVFAIYEAEKMAGMPLPNLSDGQLQSLGLV